MVPADTRVRQPPVPMILTRGYNPNASREGMHVSSSADPGARGSGSQQTLVQRSDNHFNQLNIANTVLVASQDPAMTSLIEATAELRHGEHVAEIKSEAERSWGQTSSCPCPSRAGAREESEWSGRNFARAHACRGSPNVGKGRGYGEDYYQRRLRDQSEEYRNSEQGPTDGADEKRVLDSGGEEGREDLRAWGLSSHDCWWARLPRHRFTLRYQIQHSKREAKPNLKCWILPVFL